MSIYLNTDEALENYKKLINSKYFIDKSMIIDKFNGLINMNKKYIICVINKMIFLLRK